MMEWQTELDKLRRDHRTPLIMTALLSILLLLAIWQFAAAFITPDPIVTTVTQPAPAPLQNLGKLHLFGVYASNLDSLPMTQLPFILEGTVVFLDTPHQSRALVSSSSGPAKVYQVGSALPGNATITRIAKDYVVLNNNGALEKLALPIHILTSGE